MHRFLEKVIVSIFVLLYDLQITKINLFIDFGETLPLIIMPPEYGDVMNTLGRSHDEELLIRLMKERGNRFILNLMPKGHFKQNIFDFFYVCKTFYYEYF